MNINHILILISVYIFYLLPNAKISLHFYRLKIEGYLEAETYPMSLSAQFLIEIEPVNIIW